MLTNGGTYPFLAGYGCRAEKSAPFQKSAWPSPMKKPPKPSPAKIEPKARTAERDQHHHRRFMGTKWCAVAVASTACAASRRHGVIVVMACRHDAPLACSQCAAPKKVMKISRQE